MSLNKFISAAIVAGIVSSDCGHYRPPGVIFVSNSSDLSQLNDPAFERAAKKVEDGYVIDTDVRQDIAKVSDVIRKKLGPDALGVIDKCIFGALSNCGSPSYFMNINPPVHAERVEWVVPDDRAAQNCDILFRDCLKSEVEKIDNAPEK